MQPHRLAIFIYLFFFLRKFERNLGKILANLDEIWAKVINI